MSEQDAQISFPPTPVLVVVDAFVDPEHEEEFNRWYDEKHMPLTVSCPGFRIGARYRSSDDKERKYTTLYVVDDEATMETEELAAIRGFDHLTPYVRYERRIYRPVSSYAKAKGELERY
ncbi:MAG: hypothetical protein JSS68_00930 [Actinobacteria bacterium]|nr:hypothetical protein [Actinomycetota bacterium]